MAAAQISSFLGAHRRSGEQVGQSGFVRFQPIQHFQGRLILTAGHHEQALVEQGLFGGLVSGIENEIGQRFMCDLGGATQYSFLSRCRTLVNQLTSFHPVGPPKGKPAPKPVGNIFVGPVLLAAPCNNVRPLKLETVGVKAVP